MRNEKGQAPNVLVFLLLVFVTRSHSEPLRIVASTPDLAVIAQEIGGGHLAVESLCQPNQDPHSFEILPRHVIAVRHADVYLRVGAGLDYWSDELLSAAENNRLLVIDCSDGITLIHDGESENHEHGHDSHLTGNPHYWLGPTNVPLIAANIVSGLQQVDPARSQNYTRSLAQFTARFDSALIEWVATMANCRGVRMVTYHRSWDYFARDFGLEIIGTVEPHPGAEPSPESLALLENNIRSEHARLLLLEPFESDRLARLLARDTGIIVVTVSPSAGGSEAGRNIFSFFDFLTRKAQAHCAAPHP